MLYSFRYFSHKYAIHDFNIITFNYHIIISLKWIKTQSCSAAQQWNGEKEKKNWIADIGTVVHQGKYKYNLIIIYMRARCAYSIIITRAKFSILHT